MLDETPDVFGLICLICLIGRAVSVKIVVLSLLFDSLLFSAGNSLNSLEEEKNTGIVNTKVLENKTLSFLVAPIPFSNPTLGTGLNVVGLYMQAQRDETSLSPTTAIIGLYSSNKSWMSGIYHEDYWGSGKHRMKAGVGLSELNLKYYGIGNLKGNDDSIDYTMSVTPIIARYQRQLPYINNFYCGVQYLALIGKIETSIPSDTLPIDGSFNASALGLVATYDTRNEVYFPTHGWYSETVFNHYTKKIGSDFDTDLFKTFVTYYLPHLKGSTLATKFEYKHNSSVQPFFLLPSISLRGFDRTRYLDKTVMQVQTEERYRFASRLTAVAFVGAGAYGDDVTSYNSDSLVFSYGAGLRYQVLEDKRINISVDIAFGEGDSAVYLRLGEAF